MLCCCTDCKGKFDLLSVILGFINKNEFVLSDFQCRDRLLLPLFPMQTRWQYATDVQQQKQLDGEKATVVIVRCVKLFQLWPCDLTSTKMILELRLMI